MNTVKILRKSATILRKIVAYSLAFLLGVIASTNELKEITTLLLNILFILIILCVILMITANYIERTKALKI